MEYARQNRRLGDRRMIRQEQSGTVAQGVEFRPVRFRKGDPRDLIIDSEGE